MKIKNVAVTAGSTVGLFSASGATVAASSVSVKSNNASIVFVAASDATVAASSVSVKSNNASIVFVAASDGSGDPYPVDGQTFTSSSEVYVKNTGTYDSIVTVRISS